MKPAQKLRKDIESCELAHPMFNEHARELKQCIDDAIAGFAPKVNAVSGPSGVGKSSLIASLARDYPVTRVNGRLQAPVLVVEVRQFATAKSLPNSVLNALGLQISKTASADAMFEMMLKQLELAGTRIVIFDEISHLVEEGTRVPPRAASDWLKSLVDRAQISLILFGIPRLQKLFTANEQLRRRSRPARNFFPYDACDPQQMKAYSACVINYTRMFEAAGYPIAVAVSVLIQQSYLLTGGLIGVLSDFMRELASIAARSDPRPMTYADCRRVLDAIHHAGSPHMRAFQAEAEEAQDYGVSMEALKQAYAHVLTSNSASVPVPKNTGGN